MVEIQRVYRFETHRNYRKIRGRSRDRLVSVFGARPRSVEYKMIPLRVPADDAAAQYRDRH